MTDDELYLEGERLFNDFKEIFERLNSAYWVRSGISMDTEYAMVCSLLLLMNGLTPSKIKESR